MTRPLRLVAILSLAVLGWGLGRPAVAEPVDLHLVLAVDVSRSIDEAQYQLQRKGYAAALTDARVLQVIRSRENRRIPICYFEWSGESYQQVIVDWTVVGDLETAADVANQLLTAPRPFANRTSPGVAIDFPTAHFQRSPPPPPPRNTTLPPAPPHPTPLD